MSVSEMPKGWDALNAAIATARAELLAAAPDAASVVEAEAYLLRVMTQSLDDVFLSHLFTEHGLSRALPTKGGPNPHYQMYFAGIDATRRYRLQGKLHDSERAGVGLYTYTAAGTALLAGYAAFDHATTNNGEFALEIAADATGPGTLTIQPGTRVLLIRVLHRSRGQSCQLFLQGGNPVNDLALAGGSAERALTQAGQATLRAIKQFLHWSRLTSESPNQFTLPPAGIAEETQGDPDTTYILGYYQLGDGEYLEALLPANIKGYWSLHAYNHWCEALPNACMDDLTAIAHRDDAGDGNIRICIGPAVPATLPNRIDTLGRARGALILRFVGASITAIPQTAVRQSQA